MPKIPFVSGQVQAQGAKIQHPWEFNNTGANMAQIGRIISKEAEEWDKSISDARDTSELAKVKTELIKDKADLLDKFDQRDDYANFLPELKESHATNQEKYRGMVTNPKLWDKLQPQIMQDNLTDMVHVKQLSRKKEIDAYKTDYLKNVDFIVDYAGKLDKEGSGNLVAEMNSMSAEAIKKGIITSYEAEKKLEQVQGVIDWNRVRNDINKKDPDEMRQILSNIKDTYPNLSDDHYYRAMNLVESKERQIAREQASIQKDLYNAGAKQAFDRWEQWTVGKRGPDNTGFEQWLEAARENETISEKTYESFAAKIANEKTRKAYEKTTGKVIATLGNWQTYQTVLGQIKDGTLDSLDDVAAATKGLPKNMTTELMKLASGGKPTDKAKAKGMQFLLKKAKEMELDTDGMQDLKEEYDLRTKDGKVTDMMDIAKDMAGNIEDNSLKAQIMKKKAEQGKSPGVLQRISNTIFGGKAKAEEPKKAENTEESIRKQLADKGIKDKAQQDIWILKYKDAGIIKAK